MAIARPFHRNTYDDNNMYDMIKNKGNNKLRNSASQTSDFVEEDDNIRFLYGVLLISFVFILLLGIDEYNQKINNRHHYDPFAFKVDFLEVNSMAFSVPNNSIASNQPLSLNFTVVTKTAKLFNNLQTTIEYDHRLVSSSKTIAPFHVGALAVKTIPVLMDMVDTRLPDTVIDSINRKLASDGVLDFTVIFEGDNWNVDDKTRGESCDMKMVCKGVRVTLSSTNNTWNGFTKDGPFPCIYSSKGCY